MMKKVLVIEDELQTRNLFIRCLTFEGFCAIGAENGEVGLKLAQASSPDLIVCDIMMPDLDGYTVLSTLRGQAATSAIPFIFLTAKVTMPELRHGMELGADDYLTKPCTVEQFLAAITTRLKRQEDLKRCYEKPLQPGRSLPLQSLPAVPVATKTSAKSALSNIFPDCPKLQPVFRYIEAYYHQPIHLRDVAKVAGYSPAYLTNLVQNQTGRTVKQWIIERRMAQARRLLINTGMPVKQIAEDAGYADVGYFVRQFRQVHGLSPQAWRKSIET